MANIATSHDSLQLTTTNDTVGNKDWIVGTKRFDTLGDAQQYAMSLVYIQPLTTVPVYEKVYEASLPVTPVPQMIQVVDTAIEIQPLPVALPPVI